MAKSVLTGAQAASFKGIPINAQLVDWSDTRKPGLAVHRVLKRDGAIIENMGREPHVVKMNLFYMGQNWLTDFLKLSNSVDEDPTGNLVHPAFGSMPVACQGFEGASVNTETGRDMYVIPVSFIENTIDPKAIPVTQTVGEANQDVTDNTSSLQSAAESFPTAAIPVSAYVTVALAFSAAALASSVNSLVDSTLLKRLGDVEIKGAAARDAVRADPAATNDAVTYPVIALIEQVYASCLSMNAALKTVKPVLFKYTLPVATHIAVLAARFYGKDGRFRINEIEANNPGKIPNPASIAAGTVLLMATPTVANANI